MLITAEELTYDRTLSVIAAQGHVEISTQRQVVFAASVSYHAKQDLLLATGDVMLLDSDGHVAFADYFKLTGNLKQVFAHKLRVFMSDNSLLISSYGIFNLKKRNVLYNTSYTECLVCAREEHIPPLWRIRAAEVTYDVEQQHVAYHGAWLEMWGIPVVYTPYLSHPGPRVKRRSGFLTPTLGRTRHRGLTIRLPYFWALSPHSDLTLEVLFSHKNAPVLTAEYRAALGSGVTENELRITRDNYGKIHGYIESNTIYYINNKYRTMLKIKRTINNTYINKKSNTQEWIKSYAIFEGFGTRSYGAVHAYTFQSLRDKSTRGSLPLVFPLVVYSYTGNSVWLGHPALDANLLMLHPPKESHMFVTGSWIIPYISNIGNLFTIKTNLSSSIHLKENLEEFPFIFLLPEVVVKWHYPLVVYSSHKTIIEPRIVFTVGSPHRIAHKTPHTVFNNLFTLTLNHLNHLTELCPVVTGPQLSYGLKVSQYDDMIGRLSLIIGQRYSFYPQKNCGADSDFFSDLIGQVDVVSTGHLSLLYRFRFNTKDMTIRYNELNMNIGPKALQLGIDYAFIDRRIKQKMNNHHAFGVKLKSFITDNWMFQLNGLYQLQYENRLISWEISARYEDECFLFRGTVSRNNTRGHAFRAGGLDIALEFSLKAL